MKAIINVILCERGIRTYETYTRNTLDMSAVAAVKHFKSFTNYRRPKSWYR